MWVIHLSTPAMYRDKQKSEMLFRYMAEGTIHVCISHLSFIEPNDRFVGD